MMPEPSAEPAYVVDRAENEPWSHYPMGKYALIAVIEVKASGELVCIEGSRLQYTGDE